MQEAESYRKKILVSSMLGLGLEGMDILLLSFALSSIINEFHLLRAEFYRQSRTLECWLAV